MYPKLATILLLSAVAALNAQDAAPIFACNLKAIPSSNRPHYNELTKRIGKAARGQQELANGYAFQLDGKVISLTQVAEWISLERLCCPFLTLELATSGAQSGWTLRLTGPEGVKAFLKEEFAGL